MTQEASIMAPSPVLAVSLCDPTTTTPLDPEHPTPTTTVKETHDNSNEAVSKTPVQEITGEERNKDMTSQDKPIQNGTVSPSSQAPHRPEPEPVQQQYQGNEKHGQDEEYLNSLQPPSDEEFRHIRYEQARKERESMDGTKPQNDIPSAEKKSEAQDGAARLIQRTYRGYKTRRELQGLGLSASTRWAHVVKDVKWREATKPRPREETWGTASSEGMSTRTGGNMGRIRKSDPSKGSAKGKWKLASTVAKYASGDQDVAASDSLDKGDGFFSSGSSASSLPSSASEGENSHGGEGKKRAASSPKEKEKAKQARKTQRKEKKREEAKTMGLQYFLEMVDLKHRYGSNLRTYHATWRERDTRENFFYWLDHGEGKDLDLESCPRQRLDREMVRYLSKEERQYYLVEVDNEGRLCWKKNGERIDTTELYRDSVRGVVRKGDRTETWRSPYAQGVAAGVKLNDKDAGKELDVEHHEQDQQLQEQERRGDRDKGPATASRGGATSRASSLTSDSSIEQDLANKYATPEFDSARGVEKAKHVSASTVFNKLLRRSVKKNTWIFVADANFRLYVGIKNSGAFQHSSFLQGGRIAAAGLIKVKDGQLRALSPLSGHYRPPVRNFRAFTRDLRGKGVDMRRVSISKAYTILVGLEVYMTARSKVKRAAEGVGKKKARLLDPETAREMEMAEMDGSESAKREREVLEMEERRREENTVGVKLLKMVNLRPAGESEGPVASAGEKGDGKKDEQREGEGKSHDGIDQNKAKTKEDRFQAGPGDVRSRGDAGDIKTDGGAKNNVDRKDHVRGDKIPQS